MRNAFILIPSAGKFTGKLFTISFPSEDQLIIKEETDTGGDSYAKCDIKEVKDSQILQDWEENDSKPDSGKSCQIEGDELCY